MAILNTIIFKRVSWIQLQGKGNTSFRVLQGSQLTAAVITALEELQ